MLQRKSGRMGRGLGVSTGWVLRLLLAKRKVAPKAKAKKKSAKKKKR